MVNVHYTQELNAAAESAWELLGDFGSLLRWVAGGDNASISLTGDGLGMLRDLALPSVGSVQHRLEALDADNYLITYRLTAGQPLGMAEYIVSARLQPIGDMRCTLIWDGEFVPEHSASAASMAAGLERAYADMSTRLDQLLK